MKYCWGVGGGGVKLANNLDDLRKATNERMKPKEENKIKQRRFCENDKREELQAKVPCGAALNRSMGCALWSANHSSLPI